VVTLALAGALGAGGCINDQIPARPNLSASSSPDSGLSSSPDSGPTSSPDSGADSADASTTPSVPGVDEVWRGAGCGLQLPAGTAMTVPGTIKGYTRYQVAGTGANLTDTPIPAKAGARTFWVRVPADYDPQHAYRVVYLGQGCGARYSANTAVYPLFQQSLGGTEEAIYVAIDIPTNDINMDCYDNRDGPTSQEWEAFELFHQFVDTHYCVDNNRVFVAGFSTGGWLANQWGCYFAGNPTPPRKFAPRYHIRGQAAVASGEPTNQPPCNGPVAAIWFHDVSDGGNPIAGAYDACARALRMNGCVNTARCEDVAARTTPWHHEVPMFDVCQQYDGCPPDYPVVFCKTQALGHSDQAVNVVGAFTTFFDALNPTP
jgi:hypothetical protein